MLEVFKSQILTLKKKYKCYITIYNVTYEVLYVHIP